MLKRAFDIIFSLLGLLILSPIFIIIAIWIAIDSKGGVFYKQERIGRNMQPFYLYKFRTMYTESDKKGLLTIGDNDNRVTKAGHFLRKSKLDETPQLLNVLIGDMSFVGPRPEVRRYVELYSEQQKHVLDIRPGITDEASIKYRNENEILSSQENPEEYYISVIMPDKLSINLQYVQNHSLLRDIKLIFKTFKIILTK